MVGRERFRAVGLSMFPVEWRAKELLRVSQPYDSWGGYILISCLWFKHRWYPRSTTITSSWPILVCTYGLCTKNGAQTQRKNCLSFLFARKPAEQLSLSMSLCQQLCLQPVWKLSICGWADVFCFHAKARIVGLTMMMIFHEDILGQGCMCSENYGFMSIVPCPLPSGKLT